MIILQGRYNFLIHGDCLYISTVAFKRQKFESGPMTSKVLSSQRLAEGKCNSPSKLQRLLLTPVMAGGSP